MQASEGDSLTIRSTHISVLLYCEQPEKSMKTRVPKRFGGLVMDSNTSTIKRYFRMEQKRRRKKNVYVEYDYEEAYQKQIENLEEDIIKRMMDGKKIKYVYATKEIKSGEQLEVEIYPEFTRKRVEEIPEEGRRKKDRQAQRNLNEKKSRKQCERVINENFGDRDIWATFTYSEEYTPASMKVAKGHMQNYIRRLNYQRKKRGLPNARYVYVTEQGEKGRWHHHIVLDGDMDMDTVESLWTYGKRNQVRRLQKDENGLVGMAKYVSKPKGKGKDSEEGKYQKIWTPSKNLKKPDEHKNHYKTKQSHVDKMVNGTLPVQEHLNKWYASEGYEYTESEIRYNKWNGQYYIYARMRKQQEEKGGKKSEKTKKSKAKKGNQNRKSTRKRD